MPKDLKFFYISHNENRDFIFQCVIDHNFDANGLFEQFRAGADQITDRMLLVDDRTGGCNVDDRCIHFMFFKRALK